MLLFWQSRLTMLRLIRGTANWKKVGDKVLELAKEMVGSYPHKVEYDMEVGHPSERIIALSKKSGSRRDCFGHRGLSGIAEFFLGQREFQGFSVCNCAGTDRKIITERCLKL